MSVIVKNKIIDQLNQCINNILDKEDHEEKLFYIDILSDLFSSALFFNNNKQYQAIHFVLNVVYNTSSRIIEEESIPNSYFLNLVENLEEIIDRIKKDEGVDDLLINIIVQTYSITPLGSYFTKSR